MQNQRRLGKYKYNIPDHSFLKFKNTPRGNIYID